MAFSQNSVKVVGEVGTSNSHEMFCVFIIVAGVDLTVPLVRQLEDQLKGAWRVLCLISKHPSPDQYTAHIRHVAAVRRE